MPRIQYTRAIRTALLVAVVSVVGSGAATGQRFRSETIEGQLFLSFGPMYNRVEGLPIQVGPVFQTRNANPLRVQAIAIVRAEGDLPIELDQVGFRIGAEKAFGPYVALGATGWSRIKAIEDRGITNLESSLSAFVLHDDRRDYYDALGAGVHGRFEALDTRLQGLVSFRHERLRPMPRSGATSLLNSRRPWREQVLAAEGTLHSMLLTLRWDDRPALRDGPFNGWFAEVEVLAGLGGNYAYPEATDVVGNPFTNFLVADTEPVRVQADVRRYFAIRDLEFNLRASAGGSITDRPLATQFQTALGGSGTLLGVPLMHLDCGARESLLIPTRNTLTGNFFPYYGCDRFVLLQAEIAGYFGLAFGNDEDDGNAFRGPSGVNLRLVPQWVLFANAGRGWSLLDGFFSSVRDEAMVYDVGGGIVFGDIGVYGGYPLNLDNAKARFTLRLTRRF